jgi:hypothetical protein
MSVKNWTFCTSACGQSARLLVAQSRRSGALFWRLTSLQVPAICDME